jgi:hypothetical protein
MVLSIISRLKQIKNDTSSSVNELADIFGVIINDIARIKSEIRSKIYRGIIDTPINTFLSTATTIAAVRPQVQTTPEPTTQIPQDDA